MRDYTLEIISIALIRFKVYEMVQLYLEFSLILLVNMDDTVFLLPFRKLKCVMLSVILLQVSFSQCLGVIGYSLLPLTVIALILPVFANMHYVGFVFRVSLCCLSS